MIKIEIKEGENIERALKRYKRKHRNVQIMQNLRESRYFTKPSVKRRSVADPAGEDEEGYQYGVGVKPISQGGQQAQLPDDGDDRA